MSRHNIPLWPKIRFKGVFLPFGRQKTVSRIHLESLLAGLKPRLSVQRISTGQRG